MTPSSISSLKMLFIIIWKVARLLVKPKNMTRGSNKPLFIQNVAFHSSPSLIHMLLQPQWTSNLGKISSLGLRYFIEDVWDQEEGVGILHGHCIELSVVLD